MTASASRSNNSSASHWLAEKIMQLRVVILLLFIALLDDSLHDDTK